MESHVVTANRVSTGGVVYLGKDRTWVESLAAAEVLDDGARDAALLWAKDQGLAICGAYAFPVEASEGTAPQPLSARERIRAEGAKVVLRRMGYEGHGEST